MKALFISQVGNPNLFEIYGLFFGILLAAWFLEALIWRLKRTPCRGSYGAGAESAHRPGRLPPPEFRPQAAGQATRA
jgi:hypothetical protein